MSDSSMLVDGGGETDDECQELLERQVNLEKWVMSCAPVMEDPTPCQLHHARRIVYHIERAWLRGVEDEVNGLLFRDASLALVSDHRFCCFSWC